MICDREKIFNYLSDLLSEKEKVMIKEHLVNCSLCHKYQREFELIKEEIAKKESTPAFSFFYEKLQKKLKRKKRKNFVLTFTLTSCVVFLFCLSLFFLREKMTKIEEYMLEENHESLINNLSSEEEEKILKELNKEIRLRDLILLEEKLEEEKDYYDLILNLEKKELEYLIKNFNQKGGENGY